MNLSELEKLSFKHPIVLYDGICILCENFIQDIIKADTKELLRYHSLQASDSKSMDTVILLHEGKQIIKSDVLITLNELIYLNKYKWLKYLPKFVRDFGYSRIANNRYSLFGKKKEGSISPSFPRHLFIDQ